MSVWAVKQNMKMPLGVDGLIKVLKYKQEFKKAHPDYFEPDGLMVFCGSQGSGKTLSAVQYTLHLMEVYKKCILVTNTEIKRKHEDEWKPIEDRVHIYEGLDSLKQFCGSNGYYGVIVFIDEMHLEFNSLESGNIPIEVFVEISQQRKQRVQIVGTSQKYTRIAKAFREQIKYIIDCNCYFGVFQFNRFIIGDDVTEANGKVEAKVNKRFFFFHHPDYYNAYDTYAKMKRYNKEWKGRAIMPECPELTKGVEIHV